TMLTYQAATTPWVFCTSATLSHSYMTPTLRLTSAAVSSTFNSAPIGSTFRMLASLLSGFERSFKASTLVLTTGASFGTGTVAGGASGAGALAFLALATSQAAV